MANTHYHRTTAVDLLLTSTNTNNHAGNAPGQGGVGVLVGVHSMPVTDLGSLRELVEARGGDGRGYISDDSELGIIEGLALLMMDHMPSGLSPLLPSLLPTLSFSLSLSLYSLRCASLTHAPLSALRFPYTCTPKPGVLPRQSCVASTRRFSPDSGPARSHGTAPCRQFAGGWL